VQIGQPDDARPGGERRLLVRAAVDGLPEFLRQVVILGYYQGLKYREIADILGIPLGTVKSRLHAALGGSRKPGRAGSLARGRAAQRVTVRPPRGRRAAPVRHLGIAMQYDLVGYC